MGILYGFQLLDGGGLEDGLSVLLVRSTGFPEDLLTSDGIDTESAASLRNPDRGLLSRDDRRRTLVASTLVLLLELKNSVILRGLLVIEVVFLSIDHNHRMLDCTSDLVVVRTLDRHVCDEIRNVAHLNSLCTSRHSWRVIGQLVLLRIELAQLLKRGLGLDLTLVVGNDQNRVTIEVSTRQARGYLRVDSDCVGCVLAECASSLSVSVVDHQLGDLELSTMRESHQHDPFAISERRCVHLVVLERVDRENDSSCLPRKSSGLEMDRRGIGALSEVFQQLLPHSWVGQLHDLVEFLLRVTVRLVQLLRDQLRRLLRKEL